MILILTVQILGKILFWFGLGIILKTKLATGNLGQKGIKLSNYVDSLTFIELFSILFTIFYLFSLFSQILLLNLLEIDFLNRDLSDFSFMVETNSISPVDTTVTGSTSTVDSSVPKSNSNTTSKLNDAGNALIMATSVSGACKIAAQLPTPAAKAAAVTGGLIAGGAAIILKDVAGSVGSTIINSNNNPTFVGKSDLINLFKQAFGLSDNLIICYLQLIDLLHNVQVLSLIGLIFNLIIYSINLGLLEIKLNKFISSKTIINYIIRYLRYIQKSSLVMIICLLLLLVVSTYLTTYYFNFFLVNFDKICKIIIKI